MNHTLSDSQLEEMIKSAVNSFGPLPPDEKFSLLISALRELQERRKAAMESKPVIPYRQVNPVNGMKTYWAELDPEEFRHLKKYADENAEFMTLYRHSQPAPEYPETLPCPVLLEPGLRFGKGIKTSTMLAALSRRAVYESDMAALSPEERAEFQARIEGVKALIAQPAPVVPEKCPAEIRDLIDSHSDALFNDDDAQEIWNACRAAMLAAAPQSPGSEPATVPGKWIPVSERMPEPGILVLVYTPPQPDDYPGDVRIGFDYIDPDGDDPTYWFNHAENYEHFYCVACDGMTGPSEKAPYTHWIPLPAAPQEVK
ncbi:TPA: DUF551 domain-containing protein [Klebsiella pneumoniae]|nr:DUF551 domain-containing protein [Klebsiella pneumoniae]